MNSDIERILSVRNPWARGLFQPAGAKDIENRTWSTSYRGRIGIHVPLRLDRERYGYGADRDAQRLAEHDRDRGRVIGSVVVEGIHQQDDGICRFMRCRSNPWAMFSDDPESPLFHWEVGSPRLYPEPIEARGKLQLWRPGPEVARLVESQERAVLLASGGRRFS